MEGFQQYSFSLPQQCPNFLIREFNSFNPPVTIEDDNLNDDSNSWEEGSQMTCTQIWPTRRSIKSTCPKSESVARRRYTFYLRSYRNQFVRHQNQHIPFTLLLSPEDPSSRFLLSGNLSLWIHKKNPDVQLMDTLDVNFAKGSKMVSKGTLIPSKWVDNFSSIP